MALILSGDGTVTGLAVGGLPDGTVDAGTLATNSVDSAELVDGSIDTAHIGTDQITSAILPAGSVLQVVHDGNKVSTTINSTSWSVFSSYMTKTMTPRSASSKFLLQYNVGFEIQPNSGIAFKFTRTVGGVETDLFVPSAGYEIWSNGSDHNLRATDQYLDSPNTTSAVTYKVYVRGYNTTAVVISGGHYRSNITYMEIAG